MSDIEDDVPRYLIGLDLGTTNSAVAYVDTAEEGVRPSVRPFLIPQLTQRGFVESCPTLPSFCYLNQDLSDYIVGAYAREQGALVPTRLVSSAKSWLCNAAANRRDRILPPLAEEAIRISPVEATKRYLMHIRDAWNERMAKADATARMEQQQVVLTVPASFDEVARLLTAQAAKDAGFAHVTLLEEPQAAFYEWMRRHEPSYDKEFKAGQTILVCDVGGGTTDFSLIEVVQCPSGLGFQRRAVGDHLLLGGDNMDIALAHHIVERLRTNGFGEPDAVQWLQIKHEARCAKEQLLSVESPTDKYQVRLQSSGSRIVGGSFSVELTSQEVSDFLSQGFFDVLPREQAVKVKPKGGMRAMGLPYEEEPSITRQLAHFLFRQHTGAESHRPDYILFNGGTMKPLRFQRAIVASIAGWYGEAPPQLLESSSLDLSVSRGAAYYGMTRRGWGTKIGGGIPRTYYLKVEAKDSSGNVSVKALTLLPRGSEEGASYEPEQVFYLSPNRPVSFELLTSHTRLHDAQGSYIPIIPEEMQPLPSLHTVIRYGKAGSEVERVPVHLKLQLTPIGTIALWLQSTQTDHRWALEFQVRTAAGQDNSLETLGTARSDVTLDNAMIEQAKELTRSAWKEREVKPFEQLEELLQQPRGQWSCHLLRALADVTLECAEQRKARPQVESRWWNLLSFCLRPGFGYPLDDFRMQKFWRVVLDDQKRTVPFDVDIQRLICYRRVAGGLSRGQQAQIATTLLQGFLAQVEGRSRGIKGAELGRFVECARALASLEQTEQKVKRRVAEFILTRIETRTAVDAEYWALGRIGSRQLFHAPLADVIPHNECQRWVERLLRLPDAKAEQLVFPLGLMTSRTAHPEVNLPPDCFNRAQKFFEETPLAPRFARLAQPELSATSQIQPEELLGDSLPPGLQVEV